MQRSLRRDALDLGRFGTCPDWHLQPEHARAPAATMQVAIHFTHHVQGPLLGALRSRQFSLSREQKNFRGLDAGTVTMAADACAAFGQSSGLCPGPLPAALEAQRRVRAQSEGGSVFRRMLVGSFCSSSGASAAPRGCGKSCKATDTHCVWDALLTR